MNALLMKLAGGLAAGTALGALYFALVWWTARQLVADRGGGAAPTLRAATALGAYAARLALLGAGLYAVIRVGGAAAVLAAVPGILLARHLWMRRVEGGAPWS